MSWGREGEQRNDHLIETERNRMNTLPWKRLLTTLLLGCALNATNTAAAGVFIKFDGVDGQLAQAEQSLLDLRGQEPEPVALLLPAVQKVREAASRASSACVDPRTGAAEAECVADALSSMILDSANDRDPELSLFDLYCLGSGQTARAARIHLRVAAARQQAAVATERMLGALLIGLLRVGDYFDMPREFMRPIRNSIQLVDTISPAGIPRRKGKVDASWKVEEGEK